MLTTKNIVSESSLKFFNETSISNLKKDHIGNTLSFLIPERHFGFISSKSNHCLKTDFAERMGVIRFLSMCSIVWGHSLLGWENMHFNTLNYQILQTIVLQAGRIGTINFFVITGYFLSDKLNEYNVISFLKNKLFTMIFPWVIFLTIFLIIELFKSTSVKQMISDGVFQNIHRTITLAASLIFHSAFWFVPMSLLSSITLIVFKRYARSLWFGFLLAGITLFYCINLYHGWVSVNHTKGILAYTFFIWLGVQLKANSHQFKVILEKINWEVLILAFCLFFVISGFEGFNLMSSISREAFSSIRFSNCICSLLLFLIFLKSTKLKWVNLFKPRTYVFGLYLVHCIVLSQLHSLMNYFTRSGNIFDSFGKSILIQCLFFVLVFSISYIVVDTLKNSRFKVILGK